MAVWNKLIIAAALVLVALLVSSMWSRPSSHHLVGGRCEYKIYGGTCVISRVSKEGISGYDVKFRFVPAEPMNLTYASVILSKNYTLLLANSMRPDESFIKKYNITLNSSFGCDMSVITKGACTPIIFSFHSINLSDFPK